MSDDHFDLTLPEDDGKPNKPSTGFFAKAPCLNSVEFELLAASREDPALCEHEDIRVIDDDKPAWSEVYVHPKVLPLADEIRNRIAGVWSDRKALARSIPNCSWPLYRVAAEREHLGAEADTLLAELRAMLRKLNPNRKKS